MQVRAYYLLAEDGFTVIGFLNGILVIMTKEDDV